MHVQVLSFGYAAQSSGPARPGILTRIVERLRSLGTTYELDEHLARDVGAATYTVPVFPPAKHGEWR